MARVSTWAFSEPTTLPCASYRRAGAVPTGAAPAKRTTPGSPMALPSNVPNEQVDPASNCPLNVNVPLQPPASGPVAVNGTGPLEGVFVNPGPVNSNVPVGSAGVPPQVHVVAAPAVPAHHPATVRTAATAAIEAATAS